MIKEVVIRLHLNNIADEEAMVDVVKETLDTLMEQESWIADYTIEDYEVDEEDRE